MDIQDFIQKKCGLILPIKGGDGQSKETAVILTLKSSYFLIQVQNDFISCILNNGKWRKISQSLIKDDKKTFDKITIFHIDNNEHESILSFWFDVCECLK
jgi:CRISPR/Cas system-associated endoribonuclease Cas2